ncbi:hypothetical protein A3B60_02515 [Candidatus Peregrinibacteria bacterium RIFCSPLOWO2_01_FULL_39_12]|nr:MAG: hypothetical protein A3B60_02515 [Candidatus Peregrinibacteria bacterium RIFCSPLOWO2_01_FULL_39_12]
MHKLKILISSLRFWLILIISGFVMFALQTFFLGLWTIPFFNYGIAYMNPVTVFDMLFVGFFSVFFGFGVALFIIVRRARVASCAIGSLSGLTSLFTLLCPVCPVFFLSYFGMSATLAVVSPYFWWFRLVAGILILVAILILLERFEDEKIHPVDKSHFLNTLLIVVVAILFMNNQVLAVKLGEKLMGGQSGKEIELSGEFSRDIAVLVTPTVNPFYGAELGLDFSNVSAINTSIGKLSKMAPMQGSAPIDLNDTELKRYIKIGTEPTVTCEFCCGVITLVREDGSPTCGCAHSIAMRGTAAYLIRNYPEMSDADIAYELMRQKGLYFPKQMQERMAKELAGDISKFTADIRYLTQYLDKKEFADLQKEAKKSGFVPYDKSPDMVGGC